MKLFPREEQFFEYFRQQIKIINTAADLLVEGARAGGTHLESAALQIAALEEQCDGVVHQIFTHLNATFITPLDPEDIHSLAAHLDDVMDGMEDAVHRLVKYKVDPVPASAQELCQLIQSSVRTLGQAFDSLAKGEKFAHLCVEVNRLEEAADKLERVAVAELFEKEENPIRLIKLKEIYDFLEMTTDRCEDVADALQNIQVKNS